MGYFAIVCPKGTVMAPLLTADAASDMLTRYQEMWPDEELWVEFRY